MKGILTLACAALATGCASVTTTVPTALQPAGDERPALTLAARGVQIYECRFRKDGTGTEWTFVGPHAVLFDSAGRTVGHHGAGPYWQAHDGSRIVGQVKARTDAPQADAIPWLLLSAKSVGREGSLAGVSSVQRLNTVGGQAPTAPCNVGQTTRADYTADYRFFSTR